MSMSILRWVRLLLVGFALLTAAPLAVAADVPQKGDTIQVMEAFEHQATKVEDANVFNDHKKHVIMFIMGVPLLLLILITAGLGIAMVVYGKQVYMMHMIFAGLTVTLAVVHLVTGLVWFFPF